MRDQLYKEFKKENPQTIGETDSAFDNDNFIDWLVNKIRSVSETKELNIGGIKSIHFMPYEKEMTLCRECMNPMVPVKQKECINESCSKFKNNAPVPVSEVGQIGTKIINILIEEMKYNGKEVAGHHSATDRILKLLPVPNTKDQEEMLKLKELRSYSDRYEINIQFWPNQTAVYIAKDDVDLIDHGGDFDFAIDKSLEYLKRITKNRNLIP